MLKFSFRILKHYALNPFFEECFEKVQRGFLKMDILKMSFFIFSILEFYLDSLKFISIT